MLTHVDLFSGIGGFALAAGWAGFRTICFCEIDPFCQEVLKARFGTVADSEGRKAQPTKSGGLHAESGGKDRWPLLIPDIRALDGTRFRGAILLTGGFPCQPFSVAGKRKGKEDNRHLWPEMLRVISEARPAWVIGENVAGIVNMELEQVCFDLEAEGYEVQPVIIPACAVNAPHRRDRVWILGRRQDADDPEGGGFGVCNTKHQQSGEGEIDAPSDADSDAPDADRQGSQRRNERRERSRELSAWESIAERWNEGWYEVALRTCVRGIHDGLPRRVDRLKSLGNSIVPQIAYEIIRGIAEIEDRPA